MNIREDGSYSSGPVKRPRRPLKIQGRPLALILVVLLLALLGVPAFMAWRRRDFIAMSLLFSFAFSGLFEALLNRQMGIMFLGLFWLILMASEEKEKL